MTFCVLSSLMHIQGALMLGMFYVIDMAFWLPCECEQNYMLYCSQLNGNPTFRQPESEKWSALNVRTN